MPGSVSTPSLPPIPADVDPSTIRLVASDVDGTLLDPAHRLPEANRSAIRAALAADPALRFVICTGKPRSACVSLRQQLGLDEDPDAWAVHLNGAVVYRGDKPVWMAGLDGQLVARVADAVAKGIPADDSRSVVPDMFCYVRDRVYHLKRPVPRPADERDLDAELRRYGEDIVEADTYAGEYGGAPTANGEWHFLDLVKAGDVRVNKVVFTVMERDMALLRSFITPFSVPTTPDAKPNFSTTQALSFCLELVPPDTSKGNALEIVLKETELSWDNVLAFGDASNDVSFLSRARLSVAVANAMAEAKQAARYGASRAEDAGVAEVMARVFGVKET